MGFRDPRRFSGRRPFRTSIQPTDPERGRTLHRWLPWLYLKGVETSDAREILEVLLGPDSPELSDRAFATLKRAWTREFEDWQTRDLGERKYAYFWMDGVRVPPSIESDEQRILVVFGAGGHGEVELVALGIGDPQSEQDWADVLLDLKRRGLSNGPKLAVGDLALGAWKALREVYGPTRVQQCWLRESTSVGYLLPKDRRAKAKSQIEVLCTATTKEDAERAFECLVEQYGPGGGQAGKRLREARDRLLAFCDFPEEHWEQLRTAAVIEDVFVTVRLGTSEANTHLDRKTALAMAYQLVLSASRNHDPFGVMPTRS